MSKSFISITGTKEYFEFNIADGYTLELKSSSREMVVIEGKGDKPVPMGTFNFEVREKLSIEIPSNRIAIQADEQHKYTRLNINIKNTFGKVVKADFDNSLELVNSVMGKKVTIPVLDEKEGNISINKFEFHKGEKLLVDVSTNGEPCNLREFYDFPKRSIVANNILTENWMIEAHDPEVDPILVYEEEDETP